MIRRQPHYVCMAGRIWRLQRERFADIGVVRYIKNQRSHHEKKSFEEEFLTFLKKYGVTYDRPMFWDRHVFLRDWFFSYNIPSAEALG